MTKNPNEERELYTFDCMIEVWFERWFAEYKKTQSANCEDFKPIMRQAFKTGWLKCEEFYS